MGTKGIIPQENEWQTRTTQQSHLMALDMPQQFPWVFTCLCHPEFFLTGLKGHV